MVSLVEDFDYILCKTEIEALTLENVLIKKHMPKYNIRLKDSKSYPYIKVTNEEYPRLYVTRDRRSDRAKYYGPYQSSSGAYTALDAVMKVFALPSCKLSFPGDIGKRRPCIYKDIGRCIAPCTGKVSSEDYRARIKAAERVLDGNVTEAKEQLRLDMEYAAELMEFERAAAIRDSIAALDKLSEKQKVVADGRVNRDVFAICQVDGVGMMSMLSVRGGALVNKNSFLLSAADTIGSDEAVSLIASHYDGGASIPKEVMLAFDADDEDISLLSEYLSLSAGHKIAVRVPERGDGRALCNMAVENAAEAAERFETFFQQNKLFHSFYRYIYYEVYDSKDMNYLYRFSISSNSRTDSETPGRNMRVKIINDACRTSLTDHIQKTPFYDAFTIREE
jgi:excinuclease ABC subunit C